MKKPLVLKETIKLAMLGMVDGNGHPYSWSAMFNGYDVNEMAKCPYAGIPDYLGMENPATLQIPNCKVTHIWCDDKQDAELVAAASRIEYVVDAPEDVIGKVDAVIVATDRGDEHVQRARPFVEAGLPVFIDKPLADNEADLQQFVDWVDEGRAILSSSCMRYAKEFMPWRASTTSLGKIRFATVTTPKSWERYGIHALEGIYPIVGPGFVSVQNVGTVDQNLVILDHRSGTKIVIAAMKDLFGSFGKLQLAGTQKSVFAEFEDTFYAFKHQLMAFIDYLRTGQRPFPFAETVELMRIVIAGIESRNSGKKVML